MKRSRRFYGLVFGAWLLSSLLAWTLGCEGLPPITFPPPGPAAMADKIARLKAKGAAHGAGCSPEAAATRKKLERQSSERAERGARDALRANRGGGLSRADSNAADVAKRLDAERKIRAEARTNLEKYSGTY